MKKYDENIKEMLLGNEEIHDLVYKVKDIKGTEHWISCQGKVKKEKMSHYFLSAR
ncbi:hypothetical protein [Catonella sp.]|uniref:hypothetical protein n=1 Tax=Catonella sp. TaxID=2382125 RepID=UPI003FA09051